MHHITNKLIKILETKIIFVLIHFNESANEIKRRHEELQLEVEIEHLGEKHVKLKISERNLHNSRTRIDENLVHRLSLLKYSYLDIKSSIITINLECSDEMINLIDVVLKPIQNMIFYVNLCFSNHRCLKFISNFKKLFKPLADEGFKIKEMKFDRWKEK